MTNGFWTDSNQSKMPISETMISLFLPMDATIISSSHLNTAPLPTFAQPDRLIHIQLLKVVKDE